MPYNKNYLFTHSLDWFACVGGTWIYAASRGGLLPNLVDNEHILPQLQGICSNLPDIVCPNDIIINDELIEIRYRRALAFYEQRFSDNMNAFQDFKREYGFETFREQFSETFVGMACKGFYSFARVDIDNPFSTDYRLVAYPRKDIQIKLNEIIRCPYNSILTNKEYLDYLDTISIEGADNVITFDTNLDFIF